MRILLVEDDDLVRDMLYTLLEGRGLSVDMADCFDVAGEMADSDEYDLILADKNFPGIDNNPEGGLDLLKYVRSRSLSAEFIMITGYPSLDSAILAMKLGAFDYIQKPFSNSELCGKIKRLAEFKCFVNPESMIGLHRNVRNAIFDIVENRLIDSESEIIGKLSSANLALDGLFRNFKEYERIILDMRESLARIAQKADEAISEAGNNCSERLGEIRCLAGVNL